jgi:pimeloyl-[acyl-carrier protein] methyl ester esterase
VAATLRLLFDTDLREAVSQVSAPSLVIAGGRDTLAPAAAGRWLAQALPHGRYEEIAGAAHVPFLSHADAFAAAVSRFVDAH